MASPLILSLKKQKQCCASSIRILSPAKINLYLNITGKYRNGFHRLVSLVERVSLCDEITIKKNNSKRLNLKSNVAGLESENNLVLAGARLLLKKFKLPHGFDIFLKKNIPIGAGLGGGSSNAASTIIGLNALLNLRLEKSKLYELGPAVGSDVNFFLSENKFALMEGRGEKITSLKINKIFHHLIIWPQIELSTKKVYQNFRQELTKNFNNVNIIKYALKQGDQELIKKNIFNALDKSAFSVSPKLAKAREFLAGKKVSARLSGSGSAFFTVGGESREKLQGILPRGWQLFKVQTI